MLFLFLFTLSFLSQSLGQYVTSGPCPSVSPASNFDTEKLLGSWYEVVRIDSIYENDQICVRVDFSKDAQGSIKKNFSTIIGFSGARLNWDATLVPIEGEPPGAFDLLLPKYAAIKELPTIFTAADWDNWVMATICQQQDGANSQLVHVLGKSPDTYEKYQSEIDDALKKLNIPLNRYIITDQEYCPQ